MARIGVSMTPKTTSTISLKTPTNPPLNRHMLVTYALPYANGPLHLGHTVGFIQTDIWVRFQKLAEISAFLCVAMTPMERRPCFLSEKQGISPEQLIAEYHAEHKSCLRDFHIDLDNFYTTHSPENEAFATEFYNCLKNRGDIAERTIRQAFDPVKNMFLPDRYIKGECPNCDAKDQYGDNCEVCGATYSYRFNKSLFDYYLAANPLKKNPIIIFFKLQNYEEFLKEWTRMGHLQDQVTNKLDEWFKEGLRNGIFRGMHLILGFPFLVKKINIFMFGWMHQLDIWRALKIYANEEKI